MSTLRILRTDRDLTLDQASKLVGIASSNLSRIERGEHFPSPDTVKSLARLYEKSVGEIYEIVSSTTDAGSNAA
jgi:transcriptional regulator with XRE-family HTH domain